MDKAKGRFRTYILASLNHYISNLHRRECSRGRSPVNPIKRIDSDDFDRNLHAGPLAQTPEQAFAYSWAANLVDTVVGEVRSGLLEDGKACYWYLFRDRVLNPIYNDVDPPPLKTLCECYKIESESKASNMIVTVKRRFQIVLKRKLREHVQNDGDVQLEINELLEALSGSK